MMCDSAKFWLIRDSETQACDDNEILMNDNYVFNDWSVKREHISRWLSPASMEQKQRFYSTIIHFFCSWPLSQRYSFVSASLAEYNLTFLSLCPHPHPLCNSNHLIGLITDRVTDLTSKPLHHRWCVQIPGHSLLLLTFEESFKVCLCAAVPWVQGGQCLR